MTKGNEAGSDHNTFDSDDVPSYADERKENEGSPLRKENEAHTGIIIMDNNAEKDNPTEADVLLAKREGQMSKSLEPSKFRTGLFLFNKSSAEALRPPAKSESETSNPYIKEDNITAFFD